MLQTWFCRKPAAAQLAMTDEIDAEVLARFGTIMKPSPTEPSSATMVQIQVIVVARRQMLTERLALENRCEESTLDMVNDLLIKRIALCRRHCGVLDAELQAVLKADPQIALQYAILMSIPGIGPTTAATVLAEMKGWAAPTGQRSRHLLDWPNEPGFGIYEGKKDDPWRAGRGPEQPLHGQRQRNTVEP